MSNQAFDQVNFNGRDWSLIKQYLEEQLKTGMDFLCRADLDINDTNLMRGRIIFINMMLKRAELILSQQAQKR